MRTALFQSKNLCSSVGQLQFLRRKFTTATSYHPVQLGQLPATSSGLAGPGTTSKYCYHYCNYQGPPGKQPARAKMACGPTKQLVAPTAPSNSTFSHSAQWLSHTMWCMIIT